MNFTAYSKTTGEILYSGTADDPSVLEDAETAIMTDEALGHGWVGQSGEHNAIPEQPSPFHSWDWGSKTWVGNLQDAITAKKLAVTEKANTLCKLPIGLNGVLFSADDTARVRLLGTVARFNRGAGLPALWEGWLDASGAAHWANDSQAAVRLQIEALSEAIEVRDSAIVKQQKEYYDAIDQLTTIQAVIDFDISSGWPE